MKALSIEQLEKLFVGGDFLKPTEFALVKEKAGGTGMSIPDAVVDLGYLSDAQVGRLIAEELGYRFVDLLKTKIDHPTLHLLPEAAAISQKTVIWKRNAEGVFVATTDPDNLEFLRLLKKRFREPVMVAFATKYGITEALRGYQKDWIDQIVARLEKMKVNPQDEDVVSLVQLILSAAYEQRASDIHIEPEREEAVVRFRIDGVMQERVRYPIAFHEKVVFRIKILARLRTDEHASAQDGRFELRVGPNLLNVRVSILPITHGENVVMRLLSEQFQRLRLEDLGMQEDDLERIKRAAELPHGMILATGPTGSGKTTTLYAVIHILNQPDVNVMTIEDPVEYDISGVRQIQVNPRTNLTYDAGLKSIVRQDPDVIMVGEIRDAETAGIAVNAALTGHLMLSTLHSNDAPTAFPRLAEMGVEPFLVASSVNVIIGQRLVRRICSDCLGSYQLSEEEYEAVSQDSALLALIRKIGGKKDLARTQFYKGMGCTACGHTGYRGRSGLFEVLQVSESLRPLIVNKATSLDIRSLAIKEGMRTMVEDGVEKVFKGVTTIMEVLRATKA